ncbi:isoaspartyl peptidase/L-asparaginase, partial [uncultured Campylobacter sp.]
MKHFSLSKAVFMAASLALLGLTAANAQEKFSPVIVIHGGTSGLDLTKEEFKIREEPMKKALLAGQAVLEKGGSAMDAVTAAIMVLEDDPNFNAGKGAVFTADGFNELDASIMDGSTKKAGAVAMARHIKNPILGARLVMDKTWHTLVAGEGADKLAKENGLEMVDQKYFFTQFRYDALQKA